MTNDKVMWGVIRPDAPDPHRAGGTSAPHWTSTFCGAFDANLQS